MIGLNKIGLNQVQLNRLYLNAPFPTYRKMAGGGGSGDGFPVLPGDVTRWHFGGLTNEMMAAMDDPRLEDADGKGRFLSFKKNFAWGGMSGVGGYVENFNDFRNNSTVDKIRIDEQSSNSIKVTILITGIGNAIYIPKNVYQFNKSYFIKISSEGYNEGDLSLSFYATSTSTATTVKVPLNPNGITEIPAIKEDDFLAVYLNAGGKVGSITIEQLPLYPGALVFDGVDDYGTCDNFPILTKEKGYTVVALRQWISMGEGISGLVSNVKNWFNDGAFILEYNSNNATNKFVNRPVSFGNVNIEMDLPNNFTYQTSKSYKGVPITIGSFKGTNSLFVGKLNNIVGNYSNVAIWELVFLDHDATEEELTKIKDYFIKTYPWLFPDQAWTVVGKTNEDEDRATIANITGNGNDLVLSNFGFAEGSGYGLYGQNYISYAITNRAVYTKNNSSIHVTKSITAGVNFTESARDVTIPSYRIKVTGIQSGQEMIYRGSNNTFLTNIPSDGTYVLPAVENGSNLGFQFVSYTGDCDITIEQIPEYEGYLVTDGVDDKIDSSAFKMGEDFTVVGEWKLLPVSNYSYAGIIKTNNLYVYNNASIGISIYVCSSGVRNDMEGLKSLKAICSDGRVYGEDWTEYKLSIGRTKGAQSSLYLGYNSKAYTKMIFKNLGIYNNQILSKDDCIKAYNYLQTLKAK